MQQQEYKQNIVENDKILYKQWNRALIELIATHRILEQGHWFESLSWEISFPGLKIVYVKGLSLIDDYCTIMGIFRKLASRE